MYGYYEHIDIRPEQILQKITQQQIFEFALQQPFSFNTFYRSPLRDDKTPKCKFVQREDGTILFIDYAQRVYKSCFGMIMVLYNTNLTGAIEIICNHFGLSKNSNNYNPIIVTPYTNETTIPTQITFEKKSYTRQDKLFWSESLITIDQLEEDLVHSVNSFRIINLKGTRTIRPIGYCYAIDFIHHVKILQPYNQKFKWISNCDEDDVGNIDNLPYSDNYLIISKSYKDHRVLRNVGYANTIWFQNEGCMPSIHILENLTERFTKIIVFFDNDTHGVAEGIKISANLNSIRPGCASTYCLNSKWKDPAQFINKEGRQDLIKILKDMKV